MESISVHNYMPCWSLTIDQEMKDIISKAFIDLLTMENDTEEYKGNQPSASAKS